MTRDLVCGLLLTLLAGFSSSCSGVPAVDDSGIRYGFDVCSFCKMTISEPTWASVALGPNGDTARFDDLGCLAGYLAERQGPWSVRVHAVDVDAWIDASEAWYSRRRDRVTPMGSGWSAYAERTAADGGVDGKEPLDWEAFLATAGKLNESLPGIETGEAPARSEAVSD